MAQNGLLFTTDASSGSGATDFVKDAFQDITLPPTSNSGFTSTAATNPLGYLFNNSDQPLYAAKVLYFKDLNVIPDSGKWIGNRPTYEITTSEEWPSAKIYATGNIELDSSTGRFGVVCHDVGDFVAVSGPIRRLAWIVQPASASAATAQLATDGANTTTIDFSLGIGSILIGGLDNAGSARFNTYLHQTTNETNDLHDFRVIAVQNDTLHVQGVIVYYENSGSNIQVRPGTTYVNKTKFTSSTGATLPVSSFGSSGGGNALIYKNSTGGYAQANYGPTVVVSAAQGTSGTNILNVTTGTGSSFSVGHGVVVPQGTSMYVGYVSSVSTDALTVSPTLTFGISNIIYTMWRSSPTLAISPTYMTRFASIDFSDLYQALNPVTLLPFYDTSGQYAYFGGNVGITTIDNRSCAFFNGASGFLQVDGRFDAAEVEMDGVSGTILHFTAGVDGLATWTMNAGTTGMVKRTFFSDGNPSWRSCLLNVGASLGQAHAINKINLYRIANDPGVTYGRLADYNVQQAQTARLNTLGATMHTIGTYQRIYVDQMYLKGTWGLNLDITSPGGRNVVGSSGAVFFQKYYGKDFSLIGTAGGGTLSLDGIGVPLTFNAIQGATFEGFHTVQYNVGSGATAVIQAFDYSRSTSSLSNKATYQATPTPKKEKIVRAHYTTLSGQSFATNTSVVINYEYKIKDTHGVIQSGATNAWACTIPRSGDYQISCRLQLSTSTGWAENERVILFLAVNGFQVANLTRMVGLDSSGGTTSQGDGVSFKWFFRKGDLVQIQGNQNSGGTLQSSASMNESYFMISEIPSDV